jgi:DNA-binding transcriptional LysR family regulator
MELRTIKYFLQLCKDLSFTLAASNLYITQQALSKAMRNLESELGVQLFFRRSSGLTLTEFGEAFRQDVKPAFEAIDGACKKIQYMKDLNHVRIHIGYTLGIYPAIQEMFEVFCTQYPHIEIVGEEGTDDKCELDFQAGKQDVICITEPLDSAGSIPIYECPVVLVVSEGGRLDCSLTPEILADGVLIGYGPEFNMEKRVRAALARRGVNLTMKPPTLDKMAHCGGMYKGKGVILMSKHEAIEFIAKHPGTTYKQFPFEKDESTWRLCLKISENVFATEEMREFVEYLKANIDKYILKSFNEMYSI